MQTRVVCTRIPKPLYDTLKDIADRSNVTVSKLIYIILVWWLSEIEAHTSPPEKIATIHTYIHNS